MLALRCVRHLDIGIYCSGGGESREYIGGVLGVAAYIFSAISGESVFELLGSFFFEV